MKPLRLGIVGPGLIWSNTHRPILETLPDHFAISAFSATSESSRRKVEREFPGAPFFTDYGDLVRSPDIDAVLVLTPIVLNAPVAMAALRAGKHVFMEKPIARSEEEGAELLRIARESGGQVFVLEQVGYRTWEPLQEIIRSGELGELVLYDRVSHSIFDAIDHTVRGYGTTGWRINPDFPLGTLFDGGHHHIATLSMLFGAPKAVYASCFKARPEYGECDHVAMVLDYESGFRGLFSHSDYLGGGQNYFHIRGTDALVSVESDALVVKSREGEVLRTVELAEENSHVNMWKAFARWVDDGTEPAYTLEHAFEDLRTLMAIDRSIDEESKVFLK
ncbi:MAG TPA: Gfo/Idh/MocA family oxidoreductase [Chloroflexi bacterium]|jgi:predicted dehydrogenase|nr:Gfo/Idh/MocA family oxidoreductase [Chloroflexota bacterium]